MIIWQGIGWAAALIAFGCLVLAEAVFEAAFDDDAYYQEHGLPMACGFLLAAILLDGLTRLRRNRGARRLVDPETGEDVILDPADSLFFVPLRFLAPVCVGVAVLVLVFRGL